MKFDLIINQIDEHNEVGIMLSKKFNPKTVVILHSSERKNDVDKLKGTYIEILSDILFLEEEVEVDKYESLKGIIEKYKDKSILVNLNGGSRITSLLLFMICKELNIQSIYVDIINKKRYVFSNNCRVIGQQLDDMNMEDIIRLAGATIISDSTELTLKSDISDFTKVILKNIDVWKIYKHKLYDNNVFIHDYKDTSKVNINTNLINDEERKILDRILDNLKNLKEIEFKHRDGLIEVKFNNNYLKSFIFKSGTWLEVLASMAMSMINGIDEVKSGLIFFWSEDGKRVRNELDVVAVKDSALICVSCKDSEKYDENALNELQVYSEKIGGKKAIKILVATKEPAKVSVIDRAKEMGINLVIIDKSIDELREKFESIIESNF